MAEESMDAKTLRINRIYPPDLQTHFVQSVVAQHQVDYFVLSFFEVWPPLILGETEDEKRREVETLESVDAKCVARFVLTPDRMREIVDILTENLRKYDVTMSQGD